MNKTKIEYVDYTWNPVTGCLHNCNYCYAKKIAKRFPDNYREDFMPEFRPERLIEPELLKHGAKIFVVSMGDLFGDWVPSDWINKIIKVCENEQRSTFMFLTKNPKRYWDFKFPKNCWLGFSASSTSDYLERIQFVNRMKRNIVFASIEPIQEPMDLDGTILPDWIIVGAETGNRKNAPQPASWWIENLLKDARNKNVPVFLKDSLNYRKKINEFPRGKND